MARIKTMIFKTVIGYLLLFSFSGSAYAYYCSNGRQSVDWQGSGTITTSINAVSVNKSITDILLTDMNTYAYCNGTPITGYEDALRTESITLSSALTKLGFTAYIKSFGGEAYATPPNKVCIWPDSKCTVSGSARDFTKPINAQIGISRKAGSGNWRTGSTIPAGTEIARMQTQMRYFGGAWGHTITWIFVLNNQMVIPAYTCSVTHYDKNVTLPEVSRSALRQAGVGRYNNAKKELNFTLACDLQTAVSVTFEGTPLSGTENVLKNLQAGNANVGVQMTFSDETPVKLDTSYAITSSAQASEILKLNAYYYYKGGSLSAGPIKANTTFTFDYQ